MTLPPLVIFLVIFFQSAKVLEYMLQNSGKLYHHKMKLNRQKENATDSEQLEYLYKRHEIYLTHESIAEDQILG